jgi:hypothetical protein
MDSSESGDWKAAVGMATRRAARKVARRERLRRFTCSLSRKSTFYWIFEAQGGRGLQCGMRFAELERAFKGDFSGVN